MSDWRPPDQAPTPGAPPAPPGQGGTGFAPQPAAWGAPAPGASGPWRSLSGLANALRVLFIVAAVGVVIVAALAQAMRTALVDFDESGDLFGDGQDAEDAVGAFIGAAGFFSLFSIAIFVCIIIWMFRLAKNHEVIGRPETSFGPGWAIGGWFIPLANYVIPILQFQQLWKGADATYPRGDPGWKQGSQSGLLWAWWGTYTAGSILASVGYFQIQPTEEVEDGGDITVLDFLANLDGVKSGVTLMIVGCIALLAASVLGVYVVLRLSKRQGEAAQALGIATGGGSVGVPTGSPVPPVPPGATPAGSTPAGWHPDPQGRFDHRYWDGSRWTDQVSRNGQQTTDPL